MRVYRIKIKRLIKHTVLTIMIVYVPLAIAAFTTNLFSKPDKYAAILLSAHAITDHDHWAPVCAYLGSYPAWTLYFNSKGLKTDYIFSATKNDFKQVLLDEKYQSIVLVGHGSYNSWRATDDTVSNHDIKMMKGKFKKKSGEWFQLSCPEKDYSPVHLGELVMKSGKSYRYIGDAAYAFDFILDALTAFRHIKAETEEIMAG